MRKLTSFFISLDGVVESPNKFVRQNVYNDIVEIIRETIAGQDSGLQGRKMIKEWADYWPDSAIEPFASFINKQPKFVVSSTLCKLVYTPS